MFKCLAVFTGLLISIPSIAGNGFKFDTPRKPSRIEPVFNLDFRNSFIRGNSIKIGGFKGGIMLHGRHRLGIGFYFLARTVHTQRLIPNTQTSADFQLHFNYLTLYYEYVLLSKRRWELSLPIHAGIAQTYSSITPTEGNITVTTKTYPGIFEPSITGHYRIIKWVGIGTGMGFRFATTSISTDQINQRFTAPIYIIKIKIFVGDIFRDLRSKN